MYTVPTNKRIYIPPPKWDCPIIGPIDTTTMAHIFRFHSPSTEASLRTILGEEFLQNASSSVYYSDVVSCFLSNCMDLVQDPEFVEKFANTYIQDYFTPSIGYNVAINSYDTRNHNGLLGGIFSPDIIALCDAASCVYNAIKVAVNNNCELVFTHALKEHDRDLSASKSFAARVDVVLPGKSNSVLIYKMITDQDLGAFSNFLGHKYIMFLRWPDYQPRESYREEARVGWEALKTFVDLMEVEEELQRVVKEAQALEDAVTKETESRPTKRRRSDPSPSFG
ncbi:hypothetical protein SUGI_0448670 [Cryptomeria japonica]|nr:hypothetical protein SUGI_0448670 [Cryptomeria japonica]